MVSLIINVTPTTKSTRAHPSHPFVASPLHIYIEFLVKHCNDNNGMQMPPLDKMFHIRTKNKKNFTSTVHQPAVLAKP